MSCPLFKMCSEKVDFFVEATTSDHVLNIM